MLKPFDLQGLFIFLCIKVALVTEDTSGNAGLLLSITLMVGGISAIVTHKKKVGSIITGIIFGIGGLIGVSNQGVYADLQVWSILSLIFAAIFILSGIFQKKE